MSEFTFEPPAPPSPPPVPPLPWERPGAGVGDLWPTLTLLLGRPGEAFLRLSPTASVGRALVFGLVVYVISNALAQLWTLALSSAMQGMLDRLGGGAFSEFQQFQLSPGVQYILNVFLSPFIFVIGTLIGAGVVHLILLLLGGAPGGFETTLRVNAYSAAPTVAMVIPFLGGVIAMIWWIVLLIVGLAAAHRIPTGRAAAAVLIPVALCCVCLIVGIAVFAASLTAMLGAAAK
ncbi:MAG TPA: YIP1 family protein [Candidatus Polarisedimenticolaceae bacterium]